MNSFVEKLRGEPIGTIAVLITIIPFLYGVTNDYISSIVHIDVRCEASLNNNFFLEDGFLYYESRCLISNQSKSSLSIVSITPVMLSGEYPYSLIGSANLIPTIRKPYNGRLGTIYKDMALQFPINIKGNESFAANVVFITAVGQMRKIKPGLEKGSCSSELEINALSSVQICFSNEEEVSTVDGIIKQRNKTAKEQIYTGISYPWIDLDGFGLSIRLGSGRRYVMEADLNDTKGYQCNEDIRALSCEGFPDKTPRLIDIGHEPDYKKEWWEIVIIAISVLVLAIIIQMLLKTIYKYIKLYVNSLKVSR